MPARGAALRAGVVPAPMKTLHHLSRLCAALLLVGCSTPSAESASTTTGTAVTPRATEVVGIWRTHLDTLAVAVAGLDAAAQSLRSAADVPRAQAAFVEARRAFKLVEVGLEYYMPSTAKEMNGPALPEVEDEEGPEAVFPPKGFQVIEELLYGDDPVVERDALTTETATLRPLVTRAQTMMAAQQATDAHVWDAVKLELARIATLGMAGFDSPVAGHGLSEADVALEGIWRTLAPYRTTDRTWARVDSLLTNARRMLTTTSDRDAFDHFTFLAQHLVPLGHAVQRTRLALDIEVPAERRAFAMEAATVFDSAAFDILGFAPLDAVRPASAQITLGEQLFRDTRLSGDGTRSCSSCHLPAKAFTDGLVANQARGGAPLARNTPTVINSGLQLGAFADLRTTFLEDQVTDVIESADELHGDLATIATRLAADTSLAAQFRVAFAGTPAHRDSLVTAAHIRSALAAYQRSLSRLNSPVDRALRGEAGALSDAERFGFNVFVGKGKCATCHFLPLTNGTVPPMYQKAEVEVLGVPARAATRNATIDADVGRFRLTRAEPHRYAFRTPSIRNVALTAPYMHNGAYRTLEDVVDFYDRGGGAGIGIALDNQTLPPDPLKLTPQEKRALVAFMRALTDTTGTSGH